MVLITRDSFLQKKNVIENYESLFTLIFPQEQKQKAGKYPTKSKSLTAFEHRPRSAETRDDYVGNRHTDSHCLVVN